MSIQQNFPAITPSLSLNFARSKTLDPRITFSRTSTATRVNEVGLIEVVSADDPRFDHEYDSSTGAVKSLGLLVEEQRTNLILYSVVSTANWIVTGGQTPVSLSLNALGVFPGVRIASGGFVYDGVRHSNITLTSGTTYTATWYFRKGDVNPSNKFRAIIRDTAAARVTSFEKSSASTDYGDINSYSFSENTDATTNFEILSVDTLADGLTFKLCTKFTASASSGYRFMFQTNSATVGETIIALGLQVEAGAFPTSYIPTSGSTVTRNPDNVSMTGTNFSDWYNQDAGTVYVSQKLRAVQDTTRNNLVYLINGGGGNDYFYNPSRGNTNIFAFGDGGTNYSRFQDGTNSIDTKTAFAYDVSGDDFKPYYNGIESTTETTTNTPSITSHTQLDIGATSGFKYCGHIQQFTYYPRRLTNTQLQNLTK